MLKLLHMLMDDKGLTTAGFWVVTPFVGTFLIWALWYLWQTRDEIHERAPGDW